MKYIRYFFWAIVALCLIVIGLANRDAVTVQALPELIAGPLGLSTDISVPLFIVIFAGVGIGLMIGFLWEWVREHKVRADARAKAREVDNLKREVDALKTEKHEGKDEIVALLDKAS